MFKERKRLSAWADQTLAESPGCQCWAAVNNGETFYLRLSSPLITACWDLLEWLLLRLGQLRHRANPRLSPNTNRKRATDESSTQPPAKRQRNAITPIGSPIAPTAGSDVAQSVFGLEINQATVQPEGPHYSAEHITCRIARYKSALQALETDHKTLSQSGDPEALHQALKTIKTDRKTSKSKLYKIKELEAKKKQQLKDAERNH
ncbi:hypothetical protein FLAG1_09905 [Fusarium langsethiae]|uniref:Uncharacterized protein n=1 Tax=Fusarium langsethiae TaxID=179993 RepID=A0A0N0DBU9_FUSLA|nr:hypothetical protein FLAG1_09905 [Fusarium langsethiae]